MYYFKLKAIPQRIDLNDLRYSYDALMSTQVSKIGLNQLPNNITFFSNEVIAYKTTKRNYINKISIKVPYNEIYDLYLTIQINLGIVNKVSLNKIN